MNCPYHNYGGGVGHKGGGKGKGKYGKGIWETSWDDHWHDEGGMKLGNQADEVAEEGQEEEEPINLIDTPWTVVTRRGGGTNYERWETPRGRTASEEESDLEVARILEGTSSTGSTSSTGDDESDNYNLDSISHDEPPINLVRVPQGRNRFTKRRNNYDEEVEQAAKWIEQSGRSSNYVRGPPGLCSNYSNRRRCGHNYCNNRNCGMEINSISHECKSEISAVEKSNGKERIRVQIDSGAVDTVGPREVGRAFQIRETRASKEGRNYVAANGSKIKNYGERLVKGTTSEGIKVTMPIQIADVKRVLMSVHKMNQAGLKVILDGKNSYFQERASGKIRR